MFSLHDFSHRRAAENGVTRTLRMLREIHPALMSDEKNAPRVLDVLGLFSASTGLDLEAYLTLLFAAVALTTPPGRPGSPHTGGLSVEDSAGIFNFLARNLVGDSAVPEEGARRFLEGVALSPVKFKEALEGPFQKPEQTNFITFRKYPVVHFPDAGTYRVLDKGFLMDKLGSGVYWALRDEVERAAGAANALNAVKRLNGWWGTLFEEYVHRLFENSPAGAKYTREPRLAGMDDGCDGLLDYGDEIVLLEYKSSLLAATPRHTTSARVLAREVQSKFARKKGRGSGQRRGAGGVPQLLATIEGLAGRSVGPVDPKTVASIFPVLVCADTGLGAPMLNCFLARAFDSEAQGLDRERVRPLTVVTVEDVEAWLARAGDIRLTTMLAAWHSEDRKMTTYPALVVERKFLAAGDYDNPWVRNAGEAWKQEMLARLWPERHRKT